MICNNIGKRLKECRENLNYTQKQVAEKMHVQRQIISYHESGERQPGIDDIVFYAKLYNVSADYLLGLSDAATTDVTVQEICKKTRLKEKLIVFLLEDDEIGAVEHKIFEHNFGSEGVMTTAEQRGITAFFLNTLYESEEFPQLCYNFFQVTRKINSAFNYLDIIAKEELFGSWPKEISEKDLIKYKLFEVEQFFLKALHKMTKFDKLQERLKPIITEIINSIDAQEYTKNFVDVSADDFLSESQKETKRFIEKLLKGKDNGNSN